VSERLKCSCCGNVLKDPCLIKGTQNRVLNPVWSLPKCEYIDYVNSLLGFNNMLECVTKQQETNFSYYEKLKMLLQINVRPVIPPVHTLPHRTPQQQISAIFVNIQAELYHGIRCSVDQAVLDSKNHGGLPLGRVGLVLKFKEHFP